MAGLHSAGPVRPADDEIRLADVQMDGVGFSQAELNTPFCARGPEGEVSLCYLLRKGVIWLQIEGPYRRPIRLEAGAIVAFSGIAPHWLKSHPENDVVGAPALTLRPLGDLTASPGVELFVGHAPLQSLALASVIGGVVVIPAAAGGTAPRRIWAAFREIEDELLAAEPMGNEHLMIRRYAEIILLNIVRWVALRRAGTPSSGLSAMSDIRIMRALAAVARAPGETWTVTRLAAFAGMSRAAFFDRFRDITGDTPSRAVHKFRLRRAASDLIQQNITVEEAAARAAYSSSAAFIRAFRSHYGATPSRWRRRAQREGSSPDRERQAGSLDD